ncbi:MAG TPA: alpha/beta hydrolase, partial [Steroidobacteraceae bacterium]|nr:alpha/beta hydrolase [Steroidobacteraceae bacterium]
MPGPSRLNRSIFDPSAIDAETAAFNQRLEETLAATRPFNALEPQRIRDASQAGRGPFGPPVQSALAVERTLPGRAGGVPVRVFMPETVDGVYIHLHGGGFMLGRALASDQRNESIARGCDLAVVSVDYRLAPENPYPAGSDDCEDVADWL